MWASLVQAASAQINQAVPVVHAALSGSSHQVATALTAAKEASAVQAASAHINQAVPVVHAALSGSAPHAAAALTAANVAAAAVTTFGAPVASGLITASLTSYIVAKVALMKSALKNALDIDSGSHVKEFAEGVRARELRNSARITSLALYQTSSAEDFIVQQTGGNLGHRFIVVTIEMKGDGAFTQTFARVEFWGKDTFQENPISQVVMLSDDASELQRDANELAHLRSSGYAGSPTLGEFASLLEVIHDRTTNYNVFTRNCYWYSEAIMFPFARRYSEHWMAGQVWPEPLTKWIKRECDAPACMAGLVFQHPAVQWGAAVGTGLFRWSMATFPSLVPENERMTFHEVDIDQILGAWQGCQ